MLVHRLRCWPNTEPPLHVSIFIHETNIIGKLYRHQPNKHETLALNNIELSLKTFSTTCNYMKLKLIYSSGIVCAVCLIVIRISSVGLPLRYCTKRY